VEGGDEEQFDDLSLEVERLKTTVTMMNQKINAGKDTEIALE